MTIGISAGIFGRIFRAIFILALVTAPLAYGQSVPTSFSYQGYLTDALGSPIDGSVLITFSLYDVELGGIPLWQDSGRTVAVDKGLFSIELGTPASPLAAGLFNAPLWLGVDVDGNGEMTPRRALTSVAFAFRANDAISLQGQGPAVFDQSAHVADTGNPHSVSAAQVGIDREVVLNFTAVDTTTFKSVTVQCPAGKSSLGGGARITFAQGSGSIGQTIVNSYPNTATSWSVSARSPTTPASGWQVVGYAVCGNL